MERTTYRFTSHSADETRRIAGKLGARLKENAVLTLNGGVGAGKTTFTQGLAKGLGIKGTVNSPTFTIVKEYTGRLPLFHIDAYRLDEEDEMLGIEEYLEAGGVTVVEWAERIASQLPEALLEIHIEQTGDEERQLTFIAHGERYTQLLNEVWK